MNTSTGSSRRVLLAKMGLLFNGIVGAVLAVPILRYVISPVTRGRKQAYESWLSLGGLEKFPVGQTRLAAFRNPISDPWDGQTADIPCWVRNLDGQAFQVFANQLGKQKCGNGGKEECHDC